MITPVPKLVYWAALGNVARVEETLRTEPDVDVQDADGYSAVHAAAENGHNSVLQLLIARGANLNLIAFESTPLDMAVRAKHAEAAQILLEHGGRHIAV